MSRAQATAHTGRLRLGGALVAVAAIGIVTGYWLPTSQVNPTQAASEALAQAEPLQAAATPAPGMKESPPAPIMAPRRVEALAAPDDDFSRRSDDPDDIAAYIRPSDPEPTMAELIDALNEAGIHEGLGAFNPPGTSPLLEGLTVPEDFALPEGYVRHHQVTDDGEPLEPILMYSPDFDFVDELGQPVEVPENRVVPPEQAPPDMPIRPLEPPPPRP